MANEVESTLSALHLAIVSGVQTRFPSFQVVEFYREERDGLAAPACLLNLTEMEAMPDQDPGTGQMAMDCRFEAEIILGFRTPEVKLVARKMAAAMAVWLNYRVWPGITGGPVEVIGGYRDDFSPELDKYEVWRVEWHQVINMGINELDDTGGITPTTILGSWAPAIGTGHAADYVPIADAAAGPIV